MLHVLLRLYSALARIASQNEYSDPPPVFEQLQPDKPPTPASKEDNTVSANQVAPVTEGMLHLQVNRDFSQTLIPLLLDLTPQLNIADRALTESSTGGLVSKFTEWELGGSGRNENGKQAAQTISRMLCSNNYSNPIRRTGHSLY